MSESVKTVRLDELSARIATAGAGWIKAEAAVAAEVLRQSLKRAVAAIALVLLADGLLAAGLVVMAQSVVTATTGQTLVGQYALLLSGTMMVLAVALIVAAAMLLKTIRLDLLMRIFHVTAR